MGSENIALQKPSMVCRLVFLHVCIISAVHFVGVLFLKHKDLYQATFLDEGFSIEHARQHGHTHLFEVYE